MTEASDGDGRVTGLPKEYFFVSDLHIGGDKQLKILDFEDDFVAFLEMLEQREGDTELVTGNLRALGFRPRGNGKFRPARRGSRTALQSVRALVHVKITSSRQPRLQARLHTPGSWTAWIVRQSTSNRRWPTRELAGEDWIEHGSKENRATTCKTSGTRTQPVLLVTHYLVGSSAVVLTGRYNWLRTYNP